MIFGKRIFGRPHQPGRILRIPVWTLVLGGLAALALVAMFALVAALVALVAVPLLIAGGWLSRRLGRGSRSGHLAREQGRAADEAWRGPWRSPGAERHRPAPAPVIIDATWEDVTNRNRR